MNDVAQPYTRRRIRALYPIIRDDHLRLLERGNLIRPDRRARHEPVYTFADLRVTLRLIRFLSEATDAHLEQYRGCEIDREDMQSAFTFLGELSRGALAKLGALEAEVCHD